MGQKIHPIGLRLGIIRTWDSRWYLEKKAYGEALIEDVKIRRHIKKKLHYGAISKIKIERSSGPIMITIYTAKPGVIIGKKGSEVEALRRECHQMTGKEILISPSEVATPELEAQLVSEAIAAQVEKRVSFRRAVKRSIASALHAGAKGIKVQVKGRIAGAEIGRSEWYREGRVPAHTFRADIDYGQAESSTTYGRIGVKVWIYRGDILDKSEAEYIVELERKKKPEDREEAVALPVAAPLASVVSAIPAGETPSQEPVPGGNPLV